MKASIDRAFAALLRVLGWCPQGESFWCAHCIDQNVERNGIPLPLHPMRPKPFTAAELAIVKRAAAEVMPIEVVRDGVVLYRVVDGKCVPVAREMES